MAFLETALCEIVLDIIYGLEEIDNRSAKMEGPPRMQKARGISMFDPSARAKNIHGN